jgi:hypothetical protein
MRIIPTQETFEAMISDNNTGVPGLTPSIYIQRTSDAYWWKADGSTWEASPVANPMTETDGANLPGLYVFLFAAEDGEKYYIRYENSITPVVDVSETVQCSASAESEMNKTVLRDNLRVLCDLLDNTKSADIVTG